MKPSESKLPGYNLITNLKSENLKKISQQSRKIGKKKISGNFQLLANTGKIQLIKIESNYKHRSSGISKIARTERTARIESTAKAEEIINKSSEDKYIKDYASFLKIEPNTLLKMLISPKNIDNDHDDANKEFLNLVINKEYNYNIYVKSFNMGEAKNIRKTIRVIAATDEKNNITFIHPFPLPHIKN